MIRSFVALPVPDFVCKMLSDQVAGLSVGRIVPPENYHITLAFLDEQPEEVLTALHDELTLITATPIYTEITGIDVFGGDKPRLLVADMALSSPLERLHKSVLSAARNVGIRLKSGKYRPHITLSRLPQHLDGAEAQRLAAYLEAHAGTKSDMLTLDRFAAYRSVLTPEGPIYTPMAEYALGGSY